MNKRQVILLVSLLVFASLLFTVYIFSPRSINNKMLNNPFVPASKNEELKYAVKESVGNRITPTPSGTSEKTYRNDAWGFEFKYGFNDDQEPQEPEVFFNKNETAAKEYNFSVYLFSKTQSFNWFLNNGTSSFPLEYDKLKNEWKISLGTNMTNDEWYCPTLLFSKSQNVPYYLIGDSRSGRSHDYIFVTKNGLIILSTPIVDPQPQEFIIFDDPQNVIQVNCPL